MKLKTAIGSIFFALVAVAAPGSPLAAPTAAAEQEAAKITSPNRLAGVAQAEVTSRVTLRIEGMTCGSCAAAVKVKLEKLDGVKEARVSFGEKKARVVYIAAKVTTQKMVKAIEDLGYKARVDSEA